MTTNDASEKKTIRRGRRRRRVRRWRVLRSTAMLPAAFTCMNALAGFAAIHYAAKQPFGASLDSEGLIHNLQIAALFIFVAMLFDMLDGRVARMTRSTSDFGAQLDSLCDIISFGVAPGMIILRSAIAILRETDIRVLSIERTIWCIAALYVLCAALRLARFNVETDLDESSHMDFRGLPTPAAAAGLASIVLLFVNLIETGWTALPPRTLLLSMSLTLAVYTLISALLMVSRFRYPHLINQYIRGKKPFSYLVKFVLILIAAMLNPWLTLAAVTMLYVFSGPIRWVWLVIRQRTGHHESSTKPSA
jgi:CDP-diacylglycerol--serine O-phosphatidyltransferase